MGVTAVISLKHCNRSGQASQRRRCVADNENYYLIDFKGNYLSPAKRKQQLNDTETSDRDKPELHPRPQ